MNDMNHVIKYAHDVKKKAQMAVKITSELSRKSKKNHEKTKSNVSNTLNKYGVGV